VVTCVDEAVCGFKARHYPEKQANVILVGSLVFQLAPDECVDGSTMQLRAGGKAVGVLGPVSLVNAGCSTCASAVFHDCKGSLKVAEKPGKAISIGQEILVNYKVNGVCHKVWLW
jgi:hypothetical protein